MSLSTKIKIKLSLLIIGVCAFIAGLTWTTLVQAPISTQTQAVIYHYQPGYSTGKLANDLHALGILRRPKLFKRYIKYRGLTRKLQAGMYRIQPEESIVELAQKLKTGDVIQYDLAIIEGWTAKELLQKLAKSPGINAQTSGKLLTEMIKPLHLPADNIEGLFLPETYRYPHGYSDLALLTKAHQALILFIEQAWQNRSEHLPYQHWYQALIVASLIEKETMIHEERPIIAGVILNRLAKDMVLQIDATVIYGLGEKFDGDLRREHLRTSTPYNTYTEKGLPPTPIALPGRASILAALHPVKTEYYYFVANGNGGHTFSKNLEEHNRAVKKYILESSGALHQPGAVLIQHGNRTMFYKKMS